MTRTLIAAGVLLAGLSTATAQTITPGFGGVAITGQSGAGVYLPYSGGTVIGAPGLGSYNLSNRTYVSPFSYSQYANPTAYNFNTGTFNYNSGFSRLQPYSGVYTSGYGYTPYGSQNVILRSGYTYPTSINSGLWTTGSYNTKWHGKSRGIGRGRWRFR